VLETLKSPTNENGDQMSIQVTGKNMETGDAFQTYVTDKARAVLDKYVGPEISGHIRIEKIRGQFKTNCSMRLKTGLMLEAQGVAGEPHASADAALERLEKRVRRYKRRLKDHHHGNSHNDTPFSSASDYVVQMDDEVIENTEETSEPVIIAESVREVREYSVSQAVMQLDLTEQAFLVFRNAGTGAINIVYRREDGHVGWLNPEQQAIK
jgi:ribosomal subunit interface protein